MKKFFPVITALIVGWIAILNLIACENGNGGSSDSGLTPAVEGKYSSYAQSTAAADLTASRDHRAFMGFSMGSVAT